jgi:hypothetical protein
MPFHSGAQMFCRNKYAGKIAGKLLLVAAVFLAVFFGYARRVASETHPEPAAPTKLSPVEQTVEQAVMRHLQMVADMHNRRDAVAVAETLAEDCTLTKVGADGKPVSSSTVNRYGYATWLAGFFQGVAGYAYTSRPVNIQSSGNRIYVLMDVLETWTVGGQSIHNSSRQIVEFVPDASGQLFAQAISYQPVATPHPKAGAASETNKQPIYTGRF